MRLYHPWLINPSVFLYPWINMLRLWPPSLFSTKVFLILFFLVGWDLDWYFSSDSFDTIQHVAMLHFAKKLILFGKQVRLLRGYNFLLSACSVSVWCRCVVDLSTSWCCSTLRLTGTNGTRAVAFTVKTISLLLQCCWSPALRKGLSPVIFLMTTRKLRTLWWVACWSCL